MLVRGQIASREAVWPLRFLFSNNTSSWKVRLFPKPVGKTATKSFFPYSYFTAFLFSSFKVILRPLSSNSSKISFKIWSNLASLSLSSVFSFSNGFQNISTNQKFVSGNDWRIIKNEPMAIFRSPANEKDQINNGLAAGAFYSIASRVSRAPNCLLSLPLSSACHAG